MALKDTIKKMNELLESMQHNLIKAEKGNKAAAQRVRTASIKLGKIAKIYRKESIKDEKSNLMKRSKSVATSKTTKVVKAAKATTKSVKKLEKAPAKKTRTTMSTAARNKTAGTSKVKKTVRARSVRK